MGIWATWVPVGSVVMYNLAPALEASAGWQAVWWSGAGFALVAFILYWLFMRLPPSPVTVQRVGSAGPSDDILPKLSKVLANRNIWLLALHLGALIWSYRFCHVFSHLPGRGTELFTGSSCLYHQPIEHCGTRLGSTGRLAIRPDGFPPVSLYPALLVIAAMMAALPMTGWTLSL
jgi:hypothetical protein